MSRGAQLAAILVDSLREARDRRALFVLLALSALVIVMALGLSFHGGSPADVLAAQAADLDQLRSRRAGVHRFSQVDLRCEAGEPRRATESELPGGGWAIDRTFAGDHDAQRFARHWFEFAAETAGRDSPAADAPVDPARALEERFAAFGYEAVRVTRTRSDPPTFTVAVRSTYPHEVQGLHRVGLFFGALEVPLSGMSLAELVVAIQLGIADTLAGFFGMLVAVVVTAGFVPAMLQKGTLDLVLARPIGRGTLLLAKYLGGLWFMFLIAAVSVVGSGLALALRSGFHNPAFLLCVVTVTAQFAVLYTVSVAVGVLTRSAGLASLATLLVWGLSSTVVNTRRTLPLLAGRDGAPDWLVRTLDVLYAVLPKTADIAQANARFLSRSHLSPEAMRRVLPDLPAVEWGYSLSTTFAFAAVMLALAVFVFRRRDW